MVCQGFKESFVRGSKIMWIFPFRESLRNKFHYHILKSMAIWSDQWAIILFPRGNEFIRVQKKVVHGYNKFLCPRGNFKGQVRDKKTSV